MFTFNHEEDELKDAEEVVKPWNSPVRSFDMTMTKSAIIDSYELQENN